MVSQIISCVPSIRSDSHSIWSSNIQLSINTSIHQIICPSIHPIISSLIHPITNSSIHSKILIVLKHPELNSSTPLQKGKMCCNVHIYNIFCETFCQFLSTLKQSTCCWKITNISNDLDISVPWRWLRGSENFHLIL